MAAKKSKSKKKTTKKTQRTLPSYLKGKPDLLSRGGRPIGAKGVVIGTPTNSSNPSTDHVFYYVIEDEGKYYFEAADGTLMELPTLAVAGTGVVSTLTERGALVADVDPSDAGAQGGYCFLLSVENLTRTP